MFINKSTFIFIILLSSISTITNYKCKEGDTEKNVEIGNEVILCLHSVNLQKKVAFKLKVDEYSVISIEDGFSKLVKVKKDPQILQIIQIIQMTHILLED